MPRPSKQLALHAKVMKCRGGGEEKMQAACEWREGPSFLKSPTTKAKGRPALKRPASTTGTYHKNCFSKQTLWLLIKWTLFEWKTRIETIHENIFILFLLLVCDSGIQTWVYWWPKEPIGNVGFWKIVDSFTWNSNCLKNVTYSWKISCPFLILAD